MKKYSEHLFQIATLLLMIFAAGSVWAHGDGGHGPAITSPPKPEIMQEDHSGMNHDAPAENKPSTYDMDGGDEGFGGEGTYGVETEGEREDHAEHESGLSASEPQLFDDPLMEMEPPAVSSKQESEHSMAGHTMGSSEQHVEPTSFERVPADAPGRGMAIGLTVLAGLTFGLLSLIRPFE